jgi:hypothetical protein
MRFRLAVRTQKTTIFYPKNSLHYLHFFLRFSKNGGCAREK